MIQQTKIEASVATLLRKAVIELPKDVKDALSDAYRKETNQLARLQLRAIMQNIEIAEKDCIPVCQDTGVPIFFVKYGTDVKVPFNIPQAIRRGVQKATKAVPLRPNVVEPINRHNPGTNVTYRMPYEYYEILPKKRFLEITVVPKGGGCENMSALGMLLPSEGQDGIVQFVLDKIVQFMGKPCPPYIVGVGIGGSSDIAMKLAKIATLRRIGARSRYRNIAKIEEKLLKSINSLGIGTMGLGGNITALAVNLECAGVHTAVLPVAINIQCWAARQCTVRIYENGRQEYSN